MSKMIQIRDVPNAVHQRMVLRAAAAGTSLSSYLRRELEGWAATPTLAEMRERIQRRRPVGGSFSTAAIIRAERDRR